MSRARSRSFSAASFVRAAAAVPREALAQLVFEGAYGVLDMSLVPPRCRSRCHSANRRGVRPPKLPMCDDLVRILAPANQGACKEGDGWCCLKSKGDPPALPGWQ